jgi:hypothetical protein
VPSTFKCFWPPWLTKQLKHPKGISLLYGHFIDILIIADGFPWGFRNLSHFMFFLSKCSLVPNGRAEKNL